MSTRTTELRREIKRVVDRLPTERLQSAADFLGYLQALKLDEATAELLSIPGALKQIEVGERALDAGDVVPLNKLRRKY